MRLTCILLGLSALGWLCACAEPPPEVSANSPPSTKTIVDFRAGPQAMLQLASEPPARLIESVFGTPVPSDVQVASVATGRFTEAEQSQTIFLLTRGGPLTGQTNAKPSMLVVLENDRVIAQFVQPDVIYHAIAATFDADGDALDDVVLAAQSYQMGQTTIRADIMSLAGGQRRMVRSLGTVYENGCDVPLGAKQIRASAVLEDANGEVRRETYIASCGDDGRAPSAASFRVQSTPPL